MHLMHRTVPVEPRSGAAPDGRTYQRPAVVFGNPDVRVGPSIGVAVEDPAYDIHELATWRQIAYAASRPATWRSLDDLRRLLPPAEAREYRLDRLRGVATVPDPEAPPSQRFSLIFTHPRDVDAVQALYGVEEREGGLPHPLVAAVLAAAQSRQLPCAAPGLFGAAAAAVRQPQEAGASRHNRRELDALAERALAALAAGGETGDLPVPGSAVDAARLWLILGRRLWDPAARKSLVSLLRGVDGVTLAPRTRLAAQLAAGWLDLQGIRETTVAGAPLALPPWPAASLSFWLQVLALEAAGAPPDALTFLLGGRLPWFTPDDDARLRRLAGRVDLELARGITVGLLAEARDRAAYAPAGAFTVALPSEHPLAQVAPRLRVWLTADRLWCAPEGRESTLGLVHWRPDRPWLSAGPGGSLAPLLEPLLAALWHDLHVAGPEVLPEARPPRAVPPAPPREISTPKPMAETRGLTLPAARHVHLAGTRAWGEAAERERIRRQAHGVRGHLRRLHGAWQAGDEAASCAREFGLALPQGFTFVRPHVRGGNPSGSGVTPTPIRARGLATIMTLLHRAERSDGC